MSQGVNNLVPNYQHEDGLMSIFEVFRDPKVVEQERAIAKQNSFGTRVFNQVLSMGSRMISSIEMGEYVGARHRETVADVAKDKLADTKDNDAVNTVRSAESKRRLAAMTQDVLQMRKRAKTDDYDMYM